ncbi:twin-arginine translocase subunit TatC [Leptospira langatensis]|uniref:Sec-independent protein translocase protein TatC n=1 Tax=Leptospira langatensis TaxID=2484983 RepID=A0A5F1ZPP1_9LEPT|nr:twin-arginine translocase subunit TatC [Leptospira langatensis]TGK05495.1 twin-arginine translocase subunit TatC [Leptospira langatensis]TGL38631.1 twin-arginine translocase subunit TatC [Leptospira langatensis]
MASKTKPLKEKHLESPKLSPDPDALTQEREKFMTLGEHLEELRSVLLRTIFVFSFFFVASLFFGEEIHKIFTRPYKNVLGEGATFYQIKLMAPFMVYLRTGFMVSVLVSFPFTLVFLWGFVAPALEPKTARLGKALIAFSTILFWLGVWLCWTQAFENFLRIFLVTFRPLDIETKLPIDEYYDVFFNIHLIFGLAFQLPVLMVLLAALGILKLSFLLSHWREAILGLAVAAAVLSPGPDIMSMLMLFIPLLGLFAISLVLIAIIERK